jgi:hypothetical protein
MQNMPPFLNGAETTHLKKLAEECLPGEGVTVRKLIYRLAGFHEPVAVGSLSVSARGLHRGRLDLVVVRRKMAHGIGLSCLAGQRKGLTAAAAIVDILARAGATGLAHPVKAAEGIKG